MSIQYRKNDIVQLLERFRDSTASDTDPAGSFIPKDFLLEEKIIMDSITFFFVAKTGKKIQI